MKTSECRMDIQFFFRPMTILIAVFFLMRPVAAEEIVQTPNQGGDETRIHITADRLTTDTNEKLVEFIGNVKATQGTTILTADRLKVFYREQSETQTQPNAEADAISRIIAQGNVKILFDNQVAIAEQADYITDKKIIILSGTDTKITSGNNSISGTKITLYRDEGRIQVESSKEKRVEAFFYSQENGLGISSGKNEE